MNSKRNSLLALIVLTAGAAVAALAEEAPSPVAAFTPDKLPDREEVLRAIKRSALAEIEQAENSANPQWTWATFFVGAMKLTEAADAPEVLAFCQRAAERFHYAHRNAGAPVHLINADDQAVGDLYQAIYLRTGSPGVLMPLKQRLDYTVPYLAFSPEPEKLVWWWADALFMAPPIFARMSAITGDPKYLQSMDVQWWRVHDRLYDKDEHLFARDARFIEQSSPNGKKIFWARGEGWVMAGLARVLEVMPEDFPSRPRYLALFQEMSVRIAGLQHPDGLWRASLLDADAFPEPETSGSAFFAYALAFGINHGLLDREIYLPHVRKAWAGLNQYLLPSGILGQVQSTGDQPVTTMRESTALYATGAFILAGLEVANIRGPVTPLPIKLSAPPKLQYEAPNWSPPKPLAADATPDQILEHQRKVSERQAVTDQGFDPVVDDPNYLSPAMVR